MKSTDSVCKTEQNLKTITKKIAHSVAPPFWLFATEYFMQSHLLSFVSDMQFPCDYEFQVIPATVVGHQLVFLIVPNERHFSSKTIQILNSSGHVLLMEKTEKMTTHRRLGVVENQYTDHERSVTSLDVIQRRVENVLFRSVGLLVSSGAFIAHGVHTDAKFGKIVIKLRMLLVFVGPLDFLRRNRSNINSKRHVSALRIASKRDSRLSPYFLSYFAC